MILVSWCPLLWLSALDAEGPSTLAEHCTGLCRGILGPRGHENNVQQRTADSTAPSKCMMHGSTGFATTRIETSDLLDGATKILGWEAIRRCVQTRGVQHCRLCLTAGLEVTYLMGAEMIRT